MSNTTLTGREEIKSWAKDHNATACVVESTHSQDETGLLRISIGETDENLQEIGWNEWLDKFENEDLALIVSDEQGNEFNKIVSRENA